MMLITGSQFRANQSKYIDMAHKEERNVLSSKLGYAELKPVSAKNKEIKRQRSSTSLKTVVKKAEKEHDKGKTLKFPSAVDAQKWMDSL